MKVRRHALVLAVYLNTRGFAFVLFEAALSPVDWGVKELRGPRKNSRALAIVRGMLDHFEPGTLVLQDTSGAGTRRVLRIRELNAAIVELAENAGIPTVGYSRVSVMNAFAHFTPRNKHDIARAIARHIPAFDRYVPPIRKPWMSEDARMALFDAAALGLTFFQMEKRGRSPFNG